MKNLTMNNGIKIPEVGYGTWLVYNNIAYECVSNALKCGYRHIDSAQDYGNEVEVGRAIRESGIPRNEIFLTTKVASHHKSYEDAKKSIEESLQKLNVEYIDLLLIHCPCPWSEYDTRNKDYYKENLEVWKAMSEFYERGLVKSIGVSNFTIDDVKNINDNAKIKVMVNQIPVFIGCTDKRLIDYCLDNEIVVEAYSPIAHGRSLDNPIIKKMSEKYHTTIPLLCIAYTLQLGLISLPKACKKEHMEENFSPINFVISDEDMKLLAMQKEK